MSGSAGFQKTDLESKLVEKVIGEEFQGEEKTVVGLKVSYSREENSRLGLFTACVVTVVRLQKGQGGGRRRVGGEEKENTVEVT